MRGLAEFIMRGRWQALAVSMLGAGTLLFGWVSAAAIALVTLRKGTSEGGWILLWASLPAVMTFHFSGDSSGIFLLVGAWVLALTLRGTVSLPTTALVCVGIGGLTGLGMLLFSQSFIDELVTLLDQFFNQLELNVTTEQEPLFLRPTAVQLAGMLAAGNAFLAMVSLLLGRYWQGALYNPGGFGTEFRALRLPRYWAVGLALGATWLWSLGPDFRGWAVVLTVPLTFWGLALVHAFARYKQSASGWLVWFYVLWLVVDVVKLALIVVAIADAWFDFRAKWSGGKPA